MKKKTNKKQKSGIKGQIKDRIERISLFFERHHILAFSLVTIILMIGVFALDKGAQWFKASVLEAPITFDGTAMPFQKSPDWVQTGGKNDKAYSAYSATQLISAPKYDIAQLQSTKTDAATKNAQITYSTVYMGNYKLDHKENAGSHLAVDIRLPIGTPIFAVANGVVVKYGKGNTGFGNHVCLKHPNVPTANGKQTLYSCYAHLSELSVADKAIVTKGQQVGLSGESGVSTTPHLHFQIDTESAPWHPWWPFTSAEAAAAGLDFFSAINAGLGQEAALKNTIHPMTWVQSYLNFSGTTTTPPTTTPPPADNTHAAAPAITTVSLISDKSTIKVGEKVNLTIEVKDENGKAISTIGAADVQLTATDKALAIPALNFQNGKASLSLTLNNAGSITFIARAGRVNGSAKITVEGAAPVVVPDTIETPETTAKIPANYKIEGEGLIQTGNTTKLTVSAYDQNGALLKDFTLTENVKITVEGDGVVVPPTLKAGDFTNGKAEVIFSSAVAGENTVKIGNEKFAITVFDEAQTVSAFEIKTPDSFNLNQKNKITIYTLDENENKTLRSFHGTVELATLEGNGTFSPATLTGDDFRSGKAEAEFIPQSDERVKIRARSGTIVGESGRIGVSVGGAFSDVAKSNAHYTAIENLRSQGIISGFADGTFRPNQKLNRAEAVKMLVLGLKIPVQSGEVAFADVQNSEWYKDYLYTGVENAIVEGYTDNTFRPAKGVNRAEFFKILLLSVGVSLESEIARDPFTDVKKDDWYAAYAKYARDHDLLDFAGGKFEPTKEITRGEIAEALYRLLNE